METNAIQRVDALVDAAAAAHPDRTAFIFGERRWTYAAVRAEMDRRAGMLIEAGLAVGDLVVTSEMMPDEVAISFFACCRAGLAFLFLWSQMPPTEMASLAARAGTRLALTARGEPHNALPLVPPLALDLPGTPSEAARAEVATRQCSVTADAVAIVQPTSGTTGLPKLILLPHRQLTWLPRASLWWEQFERLAYAPPPHHLYGMVFGIGGTVHFSHTTDPSRIEAEMAAAGATALWVIPPFVRLLAGQQTPPAAGLRFSILRTGAAALPGEAARGITERYGATLVQEYGSMETGRLMYTPPAGMPDGSIGVPYPGVDVRLVDEDGRDVAPGETGEIIVRTPGLMIGYLDDPLATARAFLDDWFCTGDLAWRDMDGCYHLAGRRILRINVGGYKVSPEEVEAVLEQHPAVREAVVFAKPDATRGEIVWAAIVPRDEPPTARELRRFCQERLTRQKVPRGFEFHAELPHSLLGKVVRRAFSS